MSTTSINSIIDTDLTAKPISKTELVTTLKDMVTALEADIAAGGGGGGGSVTFTGTGDPGLTRAQLLLVHFTSPPDTLYTTGYLTIGDFGGGRYVKSLTEPDHQGKFQTADGTWYELVPEQGKVWVEQFGARPVPVWTDKTYDAAPACNACVDYIVFNRFGVVDMQFGPGVFYLADTVQLKGASFTVSGFSTGYNGQATFIRVEKNVTAFITHHPTYSFGADGSVYMANKHNKVGWKTFFLDRADSYICITEGTTGGSSPPTGTGTDIVDGTVHWKYYRPLTRVEQKQVYFNGIIERLTIWGWWDRTVDPYGTSFGILCRARTHVRQCFSANHSYAGFGFIANGDLEWGNTSGNVNGWRLEQCGAYYNGKDGLHDSGGDSNAGHASDCDFSQNGRSAIYAGNFLGNGYDHNQTAYDGIHGFGVSDKHHSVTHNGKLWYARMPIDGVTGEYNYQDEPGTSDAWLYFFGDGTLAPGGDYPAWDVAGQYEPGGGFLARDGNSRNRFDDNYIEGSGSYSQYGIRDFVTGGLGGQFIGNRGTIWQDGQWYNAITSSNLRPVESVGASQQHSVTIGGSGNFGIVGAEGVLSFVNRNTNNISLFEVDPGGRGNLISYHDFNTATNALIVTMPNSIETFGRATAFGWGAWGIKNLFIGSTPSGGATAGINMRKIDFLPAVPADGSAWAQGDRIYDLNPVPGGHEGWVCTTSGLAGTTAVFRTFGTIS